MTNALRSTIADLAASFAAAVTAAIRAGSLEDILSLTAGAAPTAPRAAAPSKPAARAKRTAPVKAPAARPAPVAAPAPKAAAPAPKAAAPAPKAAAPKAAPPAAKRKAGHIARRSPADIERTLELVVALLKSTKDGLRSEQIRDHLGVRKEELPRVLKQGLASKALKSKGQKRSTVYRVS